MLTHLSCFLCGKTYDWKQLINTCECGKPLKAEYDLSFQTLAKEALRDREPNLWRYREVLPPCEPISLGEGMTPLLHSPNLGANWFIKDEGLNPTASFKARGMTTAVSMARHLGVEELAVPSAGNAAGALSAYAAKAGMPCHVFMPDDTPSACIEECRIYGADVVLWPGLITDCAAEIRRIISLQIQEANPNKSEPTQTNPDKPIWFDLSTLKEPYRAEGKKTMGYELAEQMEWRLPDAIIYPTGGGTGLVGMWKAFDEMERMGWINSHRPKMISVQAEGCAPIARAFQQGERFAAEFENAHTSASGLRVPKAIADFVMLDLIRDSGGKALTVSDDEMIVAAKEMARTTGVFACPEGGATLAAAKKLTESGYLNGSDQVVLFNTGSGLKYLEVLS